jgi:membrane dipeptidase
MYSLGARYLTLTHNCDTPFATSATSVAAGEIDRGLSSLGHNLVQEMNRLGMLVDLSHVSPQTMRDVLKIAKAPVMFSHSGAFSISRHLRNAPDDVLQSLKLNDGVIMVCFVNDFLNKDHPDQTTIHDIADHIFHIANLIGWQHVGLGSDFDGTIDVPRGMEV